MDNRKLLGLSWATQQRFRLCSTQRCANAVPARAQQSRNASAMGNAGCFTPKHGEAMGFDVAILRGGALRLGPRRAGISW